MVTHEDETRGLLFHPVLLEKLAKSKTYTVERYVEELASLLGIHTSLTDWEAVSDGGFKKSDKKFKVYLGLCETADDKPGPHTSAPPTLTPRFKRETWFMPGAAVDEYRLQAAFADIGGPWWTGFGGGTEAAGGGTGTARASGWNSVHEKRDRTVCRCIIC